MRGAELACVPHSSRVLIFGQFFSWVITLRTGLTALSSITQDLVKPSQLSDQAKGRRAAGPPTGLLCAAGLLTIARAIAPRQQICSPCAFRCCSLWTEQGHPSRHVKAHKVTATQHVTNGTLAVGRADFYRTVYRGNFERRGNFEHRSIFSFNDLYYQNGDVYQKLHFFTRIRCHYSHNQKVYIWSKTMEQKIKNLTHVFPLFKLLPNFYLATPYTKSTRYPTLWHSSIT